MKRCAPGRRDWYPEAVPLQFGRSGDASRIRGGHSLRHLPDLRHLRLGSIGETYQSI
jgi:hypothetical protein